MSSRRSCYDCKSYDDPSCCMYLRRQAERTVDRAYVETGSMPLADYIAKWGTL